jgi:hypothetical protein
MIALPEQADNSHVCLIASCPTNRGKRYACASDCTLVDGVTRVWNQETLLFSLTTTSVEQFYAEHSRQVTTHHFDDAECHSVFGAVAGSIQKLRRRISPREWRDVNR